MPRLPKEVSPAEVIAEALKIWGPEGKGWTTGAMHRYPTFEDPNETFCLLGGLNRAGKTLGVPASVIWDAKIEVANDISMFRRTDDPMARIIRFNDRGSIVSKSNFPNVKATVCKTLKRLLRAKAVKKKAAVKPKKRAGK